MINQKIKLAIALSALVMIRLNGYFCLMRGSPPYLMIY